MLEFVFWDVQHGHATPLFFNSPYGGAGQVLQFRFREKLFPDIHFEEAHGTVVNEKVETWARQLRAQPANRKNRRTL